MMPDADPVAAFVSGEIDRPPPPGVAAIAEAARARHGPAIVALLFYGSCLRDGTAEDRLVDLYLLAESYRAAHRSVVAAVLNRLIPPNVYYLELPVEGRVVRAKYALVSLPHFERLVGQDTENPYFWARFAQPVALIWARDAAVRGRVVAALARAVRTLVEEIRPTLGGLEAPEALFAHAFAATYATELRAEAAGRAAQLVDADRRRYRVLAELLLAEPGPALLGQHQRAWRRWRRRRVTGKLWSVARLIKASFTFRGGADYLAWKIERHSGQPVTLSSWQRRHPLLAAPAVLWRLWRSGAVR
jgi:hypothetical protein